MINNPNRALAQIATLWFGAKAPDFCVPFYPDINVGAIDCTNNHCGFGFNCPAIPVGEKIPGVMIKLAIIGKPVSIVGNDKHIQTGH
jgi:hypothetical protein